VYSLGRILYQLLTGHPPHSSDGPVSEILRRIATQEIRHPQEAYPGLNRELCAILLKALDRDPERRYASAGELAGDSNHFLRNEPVVALPASITYQIQKWMVRRRVAVSVAATVLLVLILFGVISQVRVRREAVRTQLINEYTQSVLEAIDPANNG